MRRFWPFLAFAVVAVVHVLVVALGQPGIVSKAALMPALLAAVLLTVFVTGRVELSIGAVLAPVLLLELALLSAWFADVFFHAPPDVLGIAASGVTQLLLAVLLAWPLRARWRSWWAVPYALAFLATVVVLWPALGVFAPLIVGYALAIHAMAYLGARIGWATGIGGGLFVASALLKGLGLFRPELLSALPAPAFDALVMACYCAGIGLIALGSARRILDLEAARAPARRTTARRWSPPSARRDPVPPMR